MIKQKEKIEFANCVYDPNLRTLYYRNKEISKLSEKTGGIIEILASNFGKLVKKELILEKIWFKSDYFSSRSMDVYITNIRKLFKQNNIELKIKNVSKSGLIIY
jgi:two-component system, OmpR family, response regulator